LFLHKIFIILNLLREIKLKFFLILFLTIFSNTFYVNADQHLKKSPYEITDRKSSAWLEWPIRSKYKKQFESGFNYTLLMAPPPCVGRFTSFWWNNKPTSTANFEHNLRNKYIPRFQSYIRKYMAGYPQKTIDYCSQPSYLIYNGKITSHPYNDKPQFSGPATMIWKKNNSGKAMRMLISDNATEPVETRTGLLFNENLKKICSYKSSKEKKGFSKAKRFVTLNCIGLSEPAKLAVRVYDRVNFRGFGKGSGYTIFITNLSVEKAKEKFPNVFKDVM